MIVKLRTEYYYSTDKGFSPLPLLVCGPVDHDKGTSEILKKCPILIPEVFL